MLEDAVLGADFVLHETPYQEVEVLQGFEDQPYKDGGGRNAPGDACYPEP